MTWYLAERLVDSCRASSGANESRGSDTCTHLIINSDNPQRSPIRFLMGLACYRGNQTCICVCGCVCVCVFDGAMAAVAPADPGFSGPLCTLSLLDLLALQLVVDWSGLNWCLYGFRHAQLQLQTASLALKVVQGTITKVLMPVIEVQHLGSDVSYNNWGCTNLEVNHSVIVYYCRWNIFFSS